MRILPDHVGESLCPFLELHPEHGIRSVLDQVPSLNGNLPSAYLDRRRVSTSGPSR